MAWATTERETKPRTVLLDANVLYSLSMRDLLIELARTRIFNAKWSKDIDREWSEAVIRNNPHLDRAAITRTQILMQQAVSYCHVTGYDSLIHSLELPDPNDRHVLAAAIVGECGVIVTQNLKDFPVRALRTHGIEAIHPDNFLNDCLESAPDLFCFAIKNILKRTKNPAYEVDEYLTLLIHQGLVKTATKLENFKNLI